MVFQASLALRMAWEVHVPKSLDVYMLMYFATKACAVADNFNIDRCRFNKTTAGCQIVNSHLPLRVVCLPVGVTSHQMAYVAKTVEHTNSRAKYHHGRSDNNLKQLQGYLGSHLWACLIHLHHWLLHHLHLLHPQQNLNRANTGRPLYWVLRMGRMKCVSQFLSLFLSFFQTQDDPTRTTERGIERSI